MPAAPALLLCLAHVQLCQTCAEPAAGVYCGTLAGVSNRLSCCITKRRCLAPLHLIMPQCTLSTAAASPGACSGKCSGYSSTHLWPRSRLSRLCIRCLIALPLEDLSCHVVQVHLVGEHFCASVHACMLTCSVVLRLACTSVASMHGLCLQRCLALHVAAS